MDTDYTDRRTMVFILIMDLNNIGLNDARYENESNIVLLSVSIGVIGGNLLVSGVILPRS